MKYVRKRWQFFAEAAASSPGENADPGQQNRAQGEIPAVQDAAAPQARMTWEEIVADPQYNGQIQQLVRSRIKDAKASRDTLTQLRPALEKLARNYGLDPEAGDWAALTQAILQEAPAGLPQDNSNMLRSQAARDILRAGQAYRQSLEAQAKQLQAVYPGFSLDRELENPLFSRLVGPGMGLSVEAAFYALHHRELSAITAETVARQVAVRLSGARPARITEHGAGSAPAVTAFDYRTASPTEQAALKRKIRSAAARGEKIYP